MQANKYRNTRRIAAATALVLIAAACSQPGPDLNGRAQALLEKSQWDAAADPLKRQLIEQPDDVAAHFYLGRCYLNGSMFYPGAAAGEFETALRLFTEKGRHSPIAEYDDKYFELRCHLEMAKVYLRTYLELADRGAPRSILQQPMRNLKAAEEAAEKIDPDSKDVRDLKSMIGAL
jgi:tetratricopeptide (TPR) repeat protein